MTKELDALMDGAKAQILRKQYSAGAELCRKLLTRYPTHEDARLLLALSLLGEHRYGAARAELMPLSQKKPPRAIVHRMIGETYVGERSYLRALEHLELAFALEPGDQRLRNVIETIRVKHLRGQKSLKPQVGNEEPTAAAPDELSMMRELTDSVLTQKGKGGNLFGGFRANEDAEHTDVFLPSNSVPPDEESTHVTSLDGEPPTNASAQANRAVRIAANIPPGVMRGSVTPVSQPRARIPSAFGRNIKTPPGQTRPHVPASTMPLPAVITSRHGRLFDQLFDKTKQPSLAVQRIRWIATLLLPVLVGALTYFVVRNYFKSQIDNQLAQAVRKAANDGLPHSVSDALKVLQKHAKNDSERNALSVRWQAIAHYEYSLVSQNQVKDRLGKLDRQALALIDAQIARAYLALAQGDTSAASAALEHESAAEEETTAEFAHVKALTLWLRGQLPAAQRQAKLAVQLWPTSARHVALLSLLVAYQGNASAALHMLQNFPHNENLPELCVARARILQDSGRDPIAALSEANKVLTELIASASPRQKAWAYLISARHAVSNHDVARGLREATTASSIDWVMTDDFALDLAEVYFGAGAIEEAKKLLVRSFSSAAYAQRRALLSAEVWLSAGDLDKALQALQVAQPAPQKALLFGEIMQARGELNKARQYYEQALSGAGRRVATKARLNLARLMLQQNNISSAKDHINAAKALVPNDPEITSLEVEVQLAAGNPTEADKILREALALEPDSVPLLQAKALVMSRSGDAQGALRLFESITRIQAQDPQAQMKFGRMALRAGQTERAKQAFNEALRLAPSMYDAFVGLADAELSQGNVEKAQQLIDRATQAGVSSVDWARVASMTKAAAGLGQEAVNSVRELVQRYRDADILAALAHLQVQAERDKDAENTIAAALKIEPSNIEALLLRALVEGRRGDLKRGTDTLNALDKIARKRGVLTPLLAARIVAQRARLRYEFGDLAGAQRLALDASKLDTRAAEAHLVRASIASEKRLSPVSELQAGMAGMFTPPEVVARLVLELPDGGDKCALAKRYLSAAPAGYDASDVKKSTTTCH